MRSERSIGGDDLADLLRIHPHTLSVWQHAGRIHTSIAKRYEMQYSFARVDAFLAACATDPRWRVTLAQLLIYELQQPDEYCLMTIHEAVERLGIETRVLLWHVREGRVPALLLEGELEDLKVGAATYLRVPNVLLDSSIGARLAKIKYTEISKPVTPTAPPAAPKPIPMPKAPQSKAQPNPKEVTPKQKAQEPEPKEVVAAPANLDRAVLSTDLANQIIGMTHAALVDDIRAGIVPATPVGDGTYTIALGEARAYRRRIERQVAGPSYHRRYDEF